LLDFNEARLMGLDSPLPGYGDMGYAYVLSRFGVLQVIALLLVLFLLPCYSERAQRFRGLIVLYFFSSLAISGTSVFALKTAGLMWFLLGVLDAEPRRLLPFPKQGCP
jgi:putative polymerase